MLDRESPDELTLRAEEVALGRQTSMSTTSKKRDGVLPWWMLIGTLFAKRCTIDIEGEDWGELYDACKEMSRAVEVGRDRLWPIPFWPS